MINYILGDSITRIKNAQSVKHAYVSLCYSKLVVNVVQVLKEEGYVRDFSISEDEGNIKHILVNLKYYGMRGVIHQMKVLSKPGCRRYVNIDQISSLSGDKLGVYIVSTSKGVMSNKKALNANVGGELLVYIL